MLKIKLSIIISFFIAPLIFSQQEILDTELKSIFDKYDLAGMSVVVVKDIQIIFSQGYGKRDINRNLPIDNNTIYRIASISKFITATALMQLYENNLFDLDDDVSDYLGFTLRNPNFPDDKITFRKILSHTSSLRDGNGYDSFMNASYSSDNPPDLSQLLTAGGSFFTADMFSTQKSPASNYFTYSNINYVLAGTLIEAVSKMRFDIYCKQNIFDRLGMNASFNIGDIKNINDVAVLYRRVSNNWSPQFENYKGVKPSQRDLSNYEIGKNGMLFAPQGGARTSADDLAKFMIAFMNKGTLGEANILNDTTLNLMLESEWNFSGSNGNNYYGIFNSYGFGNHLSTDLITGEKIYGHPGEAYGLISDLYFSVENNYGIIFITNGGTWGNGTYSGWYNVEEEVFQAAYKYIQNISTGLDESHNELNYKLEQNFPNPFNGQTKITFSIPKDGFVNLSLFDSCGNKIKEFINKNLYSGNHQITLNSENLSSGVYFYRLINNNSFSVKKMIVLK